MENFMFILCYEHIAYIKNNFDAVIKRRERLENYSIFFHKREKINLMRIDKISSE